MIKDFKATAREFKNAESVILRGLYQSMKVLWGLSRIFLDANHRSVVVTRLILGKRAHQLANFTRANRYPLIFQAISEYFGQDKEVKVLSFGCSTGEEIFSLRRYLPQAHLVGVDINRRNIKLANLSHEKDGKMDFYISNDSIIAKEGPYDAILCLAVLQRTENHHPEAVDSSAIYPFKRFDSQVSVLGALLKEDGLFVIDNADYRFEDASIYSGYFPIENAPGLQRDRSYFDRNNRKINASYFNPRVFRKKVSQGK